VAPESMTRRAKSVDVHLMPTNLERTLLCDVTAALWAEWAWVQSDSYAAGFSPFQWRFHKILLHSDPASLS